MAKNEKSNVPLVTLAYIMGDNTIIAAEDLAQKSKLIPKMKSEVVQSEIAARSSQFSSEAMTKRREYIPIDPPFDPNLLALFLEADEIHFRCCEVKTMDTLGRAYTFGLKDVELKPTDEELAAEVAILKDFKTTCNKYDKFDGTIQQVSLDFESVGWGCLDVVRSMDKRASYISHLQAQRIKILPNFEGFVEEVADGKKRFYQPFGRKVVSANRADIYGVPEDFDIEKDGSWDNAVWNLRDVDTFEITTDASRACSELLYIPKYHPKSVYYGIPDYIPAIGYMLGNINIRNFLLQYFDHNAIPQYAVIIKGADLSEDVKNLIMAYFSRDVKGDTHKTLVIPIPAVGDVDVHFERLETSGTSTEYETVRKSNQISIMVSHGVSPAIIGITETASLGSGKGDQQERNYIERLVIPNQIRWSGELNTFFAKGLGLKYAGIVLNPYSIAQRVEMLEKDIDVMNAGLLTLNEVRLRNNLGPKVDGGDRLFISSITGIQFVDEMADAVSGSVMAQNVEIGAGEGNESTAY